MAVRLQRVLLLMRDVSAGVRFYRDGLGLKLRTETATYASLDAGGGVDVHLKLASSESQVCTGYSPLLSFTVDDMDTAVPRLLGLGATLDGPVRHHLYGAVAAMRSPDGHMVGLVQGADLPEGGGEAIAAAAAAAREGA
ncbi:hypothetical protein MMPV_000617 [Pyropia vietnamensis]